MWLVEDTLRAGRRLALKELAVAGGGTPTHEERLRREYALLACLRHPGIVEVHEFESGASGAPPRFTLEFIRGRDIVGAVAAEGSRNLLDLTVEALRALAFLHDLRLLHRDLKPANVLVRDRPKLGRRLVFVDFGLALLRADGAAEAAEPTGTLPYLAPELLGEGTATARSDLYGLGAVLHEAATGEPVFRAGGDINELVQRIREGRRARPPLRPDGPPRFKDWLEELLAPGPRDRPASAADALARLNAICGTTYVLDHPIERAARLGSGPPAERVADVARLWSAIDPGAGARVIWLAGGEGSGKTRVLRWMEAEAILTGWDVRLIHSGQASGPGREALGDLGRRAVERPTLLLLEDVDLAGEAVAHLLLRLARSADLGPIQVIAALRPGRVRHPAILGLYQQTGVVPTLRRVELGPLGLEGIRAMARRAAGAPVSDARVEWLLEASEGSPARAEALLIDGAWERGHHARRGDARLAAPRGRLAMLSPEARAWLEGLALLERDPGGTLLAELADLDAAAARDAADEAAAVGLVRREAGRWHLESRVLAERVRSGIARERRAPLSRRAAELVLQRADEIEDLPWLLARLRLEAGEVGRATEGMLEAAESRLEAGDPAEAAHRYGRALALLSGRDPRRYAVRIRQAEALTRAGQFPAACRAYGAACRLALDDDRRLAALLGQAHALVQAGRFERALLAAEHASELARERGDRHASARASQLSGIVLARLGREAQAVERLEPVRDALHALGDERLEADVLLTLAAAKLRLEREDAERDYESAIELHRRLRRGDESGVGVQELKARIGLALIRARKGRHDEAERLLEEARAVAARQGNLDLEEATISRLALVAIDCGRLDRAMEIAAQGADLALRLGEPNLHLVEQCRLADARIRCGRAGSAAALLREALRRPLVQVEPENVDYARMLLAEALMECGAGESDEARKALGDALAGCRRRGKRRALLLALTLEMERRAGAAGDEPVEPITEELERLRAEGDAEPELEIRVRSSLARARAALARGDAAAAAAAAREASADAGIAGAPDFAARAQALLCQALRGSGDEAGAARSLEEGRSLLEQAAARIETPEARADFLARPAYAPLHETPAPAGDTVRLLALYDMIRVLNSTTDPDRLLESILDMALNAVGAERGMILLRDDGRPESGGFSVRLARNLERATMEDAESYSRTIAAEAGAGHSLLAVDTDADPRFRDLASVSLHGIRSLMCVPLRSRGRIIGTVYLDRRRGGRPFRQEDLRFLEAFADHAALALENARTRVRLEEENRRLREAARSRTEFANMVGRSPGMQQVFALVERVAGSDLPALVLGESGTGKELVARAIHDHGLRRDRPFLTENCAAIPESLLESELFGHVRGAFTGAERDRPGLFELASGGTLFLDEVGDMSPAMQARLLRVLEEGELRRVGGEKTVRVDVRVVAATHRDLQSEVRAGRFRLDLLYRLQVLCIEIPPLRERAGDIPLLVARFLRTIARERGGAVPQLEPEALGMLARYSWPGNVRELENALQRLALLAGSEPITVPLIESDPTLTRTLVGEVRSREPLFSLVSGEREQVRRALAAAGGSRTEAARLLGVSRATMYRKIHRHGL